MRTLAAILTMTMLGVASSEAANDGAEETHSTVLAQAQEHADGWTRLPAVAVQRSMRRSEATRPAALPVLYVTLGVLQGLDVYSTSTNLKAGGRELNPVMQPVAGNVVALGAVKAATTATSILIAEKLWRRHRMAAVVSMVLSNVILTSVVAHNFQNRPR